MEKSRDKSYETHNIVNQKNNIISEKIKLLRTFSNNKRHRKQKNKTKNKDEKWDSI